MLLLPDKLSPEAACGGDRGTDFCSYPFVLVGLFVRCRLEVEALGVSILMGERRSDIMTCLQMCLKLFGFLPALGNEILFPGY